MKAEGFDSYNLVMTGDVGRCLSTPSGGLNEHIPVIILETFHCTASEDITQPLKARDYKDPLVVLDRAAYNQGENAKYDFEAKVGWVSPPVIARGLGAICYKE